CVARQQSFILQALAQLEVVPDERARDAEPHRARLPRHAAAGDGREDVELIGGFRQNQRLTDLSPQRFGRKERFKRSTVHADGPGPGPKEDASGGGLATSGSVILHCCHVYATSSLEGFCAACG